MLGQKVALYDSAETQFSTVTPTHGLLTKQHGNSIHGGEQQSAGRLSRLLAPKVGGGPQSVGVGKPCYIRCGARDFAIIILAPICGHMQFYGLVILAIAGSVDRRVGRDGLHRLVPTAQDDEAISEMNFALLSPRKNMDITESVTLQATSRTPWQEQSR